MKKVRICAAALAAILSHPLSAAYTVNGAGASGMRRSSDTAVQSFKLAFAPRAMSAPKLDGKLDDACWQGAEPISDYGPCTLSQSPLVRIPKTETRLAWDDKYLYVAVQCWEDSPENMESFRKIVRDGKRTFHFRDCVEMHIDGNNDEHTTHQCWLLANREKHIHYRWDLGWGLITDHSFGLNADWDMAHSIGTDSWTVEARYALAHFEMQPKVGYIFGFEPARFRYDKTLFSKLTGEVISKSGGQWLAWGAQGRNHHNPDCYGKVVLVEKTPITAHEALKLAYPDLDRRTILVQTGAEYSVFDRGKTSSLTYSQKANELVAETERMAVRYERFLAEVSNVVWKTSADSVRRTLKSVAESRSFAAQVAARKDFDIAFVGDVEKKSGAWSAAFETAYWELVRDALVAERRVRVPVALDPGPDAPDLGSEFSDAVLRPDERTHDVVEWAKPLALGRKKVFVTVNSQGAIDAWQLAKRLDMDATIFQSTGQAGAVGVGSDYYNEGLWFTRKKRQELERALKEKGPFDAFVFIGTCVQTWPAELQCWLLERALAGAKVIEKNGGKKPVMELAASDYRLAVGTPRGMKKFVPRSGSTFEMEAVPVSLGTGPLKTSPFGKGAYGRFSTEVTTGWGHGSLGTPAWNTKPDDQFQDEYCFAYLVRNVMQMLGCREGRRAVDVGDGLAEVEAGSATTVGFRTAGEEEWKGDIGWKVRDRSGRVLQEDFATFSVPAGTNHVSLALKPLDAGEYTVDATLYAPGRKVIDFASGRVVAADRRRFVRCGCSPNCRELVKTPSIAEFKLAAKTLYRADEPVRATVRVAPAAAGLVLVAEIRDVRQRVIVRREFPVDPQSGSVSVALQNVPEYDWTLANLDVTLRAGTRRLDSKTAEFFRHRGDTDDYQVFTDVPSSGGWYGKQRLAYDMNNGVTLFQKEFDHTPVSHLCYGGDAVIRDRIPGGVPDKGGSLSNPWWLRHLRERYGRHAEVLKAVNGRFVSLGDDSGEPNDFPRNCPDWIPCWTERQLSKCRAEADRLRREGHLHPGAAATARWWRDHGKSKNGVEVVDNLWKAVHGFAMEWSRSVAAPEDVKELVSCFREVYGKIEVFNRAANVAAKDWAEITPAMLREAKWDPSPEYVRFLFWLQRRYGTVEKLNAAWKSDVRDFAAIPRSQVDAKLSEGVYVPSFDMQTFLEDAFVTQAKAIADGIHGKDPSIGLAFGASSLGNTFCESIKFLDSVCPYAGRLDIELMRGQKHRFIGECLGPYGGRNVSVEMRHRYVWHGLFTGCNFSWFWAACYNAGDNSIDPRRYGATFETYREIKRGPAALILRSQRDNCGVKLMLSRASGHFAPILSNLSTHGMSCGQLGGLVESLGLQYDSVTAEQVARGDILSDGTKLLLLPYLQAVSDKEAEVIRTFVKRGGSVLADARVGLFDERGAPRAKPALDDVLGVATGFKAQPAVCDVKVQVKGEQAPANLASARVDASVRATSAHAYGSTANGAPAFLVNEYGKGKAALLNFSLAVVPFLAGRGELGGVRKFLDGLVLTVGLKPVAVMKNAAGETVPRTEFMRYERDGNVYLGVEKTACPYEKFPMQAFVELDRKYWVYDVRAGRKVGFTDRIPMTLTGLDDALFSLLPAEAKELKLKIPSSTVRPGAALKATATLVTATPSTSVFRWELIPEGGDSPEEFIAYPWRVRDAKGGVGKTEWAIGYDEKPGAKFTAVVTDVATGLTASRVVTVSEADKN